MQPKIEDEEEASEVLYGETATTYFAKLDEFDPAGRCEMLL